MSLDARLHVYRPDLADAGLKEEVSAASYCEGVPRQVTSGLADLRRAPAAEAPLDAQIWYGETVKVFEEKAGWAWVQADQDRYVGYTPLSGLGEVSPAAPTHRVAAPLTFRFPAPDIKAPPIDCLPMGAFLRAVASKESFLALHDGSYLFERHAAPANALREDWAATALLFLGVPYLWGGRSFLGVDCSGLVQAGLLLAGIAAPRDSDMQREAELLGRSLPPDSPRRRGDLLYSPGHVVLALDEEEIVHANAFHLATVREPFAAFAQRLEQRGETVSLLRRPL